MTRTTHSLIAAAIAAAAALALVPSVAEAQRRVARRTIVRPAVIVTPVYYRPLYYRSFYYPAPFYHPGFYSPYFYHSPYYWGAYAQYPYGPYGWRRPVYDATGSARLQVTPKSTEVFVDGYFVGTADDFDGYLQRLHAPAGQHELQFYLEGHRTVRKKVLFRPGTTLKMALTMEPLGAGEAAEPRPAPDPGARTLHDPARRSSQPYSRGQQAAFGVLSLRVQPADAVVLIDGEEWDRPEGEERFEIDLPEGQHRLEVRKEGFRTYIRTFDVRRGRMVTINVSLTSGPGVPALAAR